MNLDGMSALLSRQMKKALGPDGGLDVERLLRLVSAAYDENEKDRRRTDHANQLMAQELEDALTAIELQNVRFKAALDNMIQGLCLFDKTARMAVCNRRFREMYGLSETECVPGNNLASILLACDVFRQASDMERRLLVNEHLELDDDNSQILEQTWPDGRQVTIQRTSLSDGGFLDTIIDVTESRRASAKIAHLARHDALTDLPNRVLLKERMTEIIRNAKRDDRCAIMCLDLDRFKLVNDTLGHPVGDALLVSALLRANDVVARLGGDEFAIIQQHVLDDVEATRLAQRVIETLSKPYDIDGHRVQIGTSIGIEITPVAELNPDEALRNADLALYEAKAQGRGTFSVFSPVMHDVATRRREIETDLREAIAEGQFTVYYQPQFDIRRNEIAGFEALVRWDHPERGLVSPADFIPICEEMGLIDELGKFVLRRACQDAAEWPETISIAVNLSPLQFRSHNLPSIVRGAIASSGIAAERVELEITESVMLEDVAGVLDQLRRIKRQGCQVSLDDFGTGYSSLSYIRNFPFDRIKIDQSFVKDLGDNPDSLAIIRAVSGLCGSLGIKSTAEGVETASQLEILCREHCDSAQGYLFSKPVPADQALLMVAPGRGGTSRRGRAA